MTDVRQFLQKYIDWATQGHYIEVVIVSNQPSGLVSYQAGNCLRYQAPSSADPNGYITSKYYEASSINQYFSDRTAQCNDGTAFGFLSRFNTNAADQAHFSIRIPSDPTQNVTVTFTLVTWGVPNLALYPKLTRESYMAL